METETVTTVFSTSMSKTVGAIAGALAKAQGEIKLPEKNRSVTVMTKAGAKYTFDYADLAAINASIREPLSKNGLAYTHIMSTDEKGPHLLTMLIHSSGEWFSSRYPLPNSLDPKDLGGQITYGKRYSISALTGCVADDDNDAEPAQIVQQPQARQQAPAVIAPVKMAPPSPLAPVAAQPAKVSASQLAALFALIRQSGWTEQNFRDYLKETTGLLSTRDMSQEQYAQAQKDLNMMPPRASGSVKPLTGSIVDKSVDNEHQEAAKLDESPGDIARRAGERQLTEKISKVRPRQAEPAEGEFASFNR